MKYVKDSAGRIIGPDHRDNIAFMEYQRAEAASRTDPGSLEGKLSQITTSHRPGVNVPTETEPNGAAKLLKVFREVYYHS